MTDVEWTEVITSVDDFEAVMSELLIAAEANDIDPCGSQVCPSERESFTDYEVIICELD